MIRQCRRRTSRRTSRRLFRWTGWWLRGSRPARGRLRAAAHHSASHDCHHDHADDRAENYEERGTTAVRKARNQAIRRGVVVGQRDPGHDVHRRVEVEHLVPRGGQDQVDLIDTRSNSGPGHRERMLLGPGGVDGDRQDRRATGAVNGHVGRGHEVAAKLSRDDRVPRGDVRVRQRLGDRAAGGRRCDEGRGIHLKARAVSDPVVVVVPDRDLPLALGQVEPEVRRRRQVRQREREVEVPGGGGRSGLPARIDRRLEERQAREGERPASRDQPRDVELLAKVRIDGRTAAEADGPGDVVGEGEVRQTVRGEGAGKRRRDRYLGERPVCDVLIGRSRNGDRSR